MMGRLRCAALSVLALTVMCPATFAAEPAPATASDVPVQTGSIGGADAAIGAAARKLILRDGGHPDAGPRDGKTDVLLSLRRATAALND